MEAAIEQACSPALTPTAAPPPSSVSSLSLQQSQQILAVLQEAFSAVIYHLQQVRAGTLSLWFVPLRKPVLCTVITQASSEVTLLLFSPGSRRWIRVDTATRSSSPHSALCAHGWPRRRPVWRRKWLDCCLSWSATPKATCGGRAPSRASLTGWLRCLSPRRGGPGRAENLWGKDDSDGSVVLELQQPIGRQVLLVSCPRAFKKNVFVSPGISSRLCATCRQRKVPGRCCSRSTPPPCWWTFWPRAGIPSRRKVGWRPAGIPAWRRPVQLSSTSPSQNQRESGTELTFKSNTHLTPGA